MRIGTTIELMSRRVLNPVLVTSILGRTSNTCNNEQGRTYTILLLIEHEGSDSPTLVGAGTSLSADTNGSMANAEVIGGTGNGVEGRRHLVGTVMRGDNQSG